MKFPKIDFSKIKKPSKKTVMISSGFVLATVLIATTVYISYQAGQNNALKTQSGNSSSSIAQSDSQDNHSELDNQSLISSSTPVNSGSKAISTTPSSEKDITTPAQQTTPPQQTTSSQQPAPTPPPTSTPQPTSTPPVDNSARIAAINAELSILQSELTNATNTYNSVAPALESTIAQEEANAQQAYIDRMMIERNIGQSGNYSGLNAAKARQAQHIANVDAAKASLANATSTFNEVQSRVTARQAELLAELATL